jgi:hypothetical protein
MLDRLCTLLIAGCLLAPLGCSKRTPEDTEPRPDGLPHPEISLRALAQANKQVVSLDWDAALTSAVTCKAVYLDEPDENASLRDIGFSKILGFTKGSSRAVVCSNEDVVVIAFRGTDQLSDWAISADLRREKVKDGEIHRGFYEATLSLYSDLCKAAEEQGAKSKSVCIMGHSLGGAMALTFAYEAKARNELNITSLFTFGQPLLLSLPLAEQVNKMFGQSYRRFVNNSDIVTRLLPKFRHAGSRVHLTDEGFELLPPSVAFRAVDGDTDEKEDPEAMTVQEFQDLKMQLQVTTNPSRAVGELEATTVQIPWLADHSMEQYESRIRRIPK